MRVAIGGLDAFGLTTGGLARLKARRVVATLSLATYHVTPDVIRRIPKARHRYLRERVSKWLLLIRRDFPGLRLRLDEPDPSGGGRRRWSSLPTTIVVRTTASQVTALAKAPGVHHVHVSAIEGLRPRINRRPIKTWYCVHARVVITIEGQVRGMQTVEDRFVLVRASSSEDATERLEPQWREYATPYLNSSGQVVRWQFEAVVDVYELFEDEIDPEGTEVYSRLSERRLRPDKGRVREGRR